MPKQSHLPMRSAMGFVGCRSIAVSQCRSVAVKAAGKYRNAAYFLMHRQIPPAQWRGGNIE